MKRPNGLLKNKKEQTVLELLISYLCVRTTPQYMTEVVELLKGFYRLGVKSFETDIIYLLKDAENTDSNEILARLQRILIHKSSEVLMAQGISIDCGEIATIRHILEGLEAIQTYEDEDVVCMICESGLDDVETLCELLALVTPCPATLLHEHIVFVDPRVISTLHESAETASHLVTAVASSKNEAVVNRVRQWISAFPDSLVETLLMKNVPVGMSVESYTNIVRQNIVSDLDVVFGDDPETIAMNSISLVLYSNTPDLKVKQSVQALLDEYYSDINTIQKADIAVEKCFKKAGLEFPLGV